MLTALIYGEVDQEGLDEAACDVADPVFGYSIDEELNLFEVTKSGATVLGDCFKE